MARELGSRGLFFLRITVSWRTNLGRPRMGNQSVSLNTNESLNYGRERERLNPIQAPRSWLRRGLYLIFLCFAQLNICITLFENI